MGSHANFCRYHHNCTGHDAERERRFRNRMGSSMALVLDIDFVLDGVREAPIELGMGGMARERERRYSKSAGVDNPDVQYKIPRGDGTV